MTSTKCVECGIGFFSPTGSNKCSKCAAKDAQSGAGAEQQGHDSCGCGHDHHH